MRMLILAPALLLAACGGGSEDGTQISITGGDNGSDFVAGVGKDGRVSIDAPGFKGAISLPKFQLDAGDFDINGVKLPDGSKITSMNIDGDRGGKGDDRVRVAFTSPVGTAAVREWFQRKLSAEGFKLTAAGDNLSGTTVDGNGFSLTTKATGTGKSENVLSIGS